MKGFLIWAKIGLRITLRDHFQCLSHIEITYIEKYSLYWRELREGYNCLKHRVELLFKLLQFRLFVICQFCITTEGGERDQRKFQPERSPGKIAVLVIPR